MALADLCFLDAVEMARLLARREISARELVAAHLTQIERVNPRVNAIVTLTAEQAMADAAVADGLTALGQTGGLLHGLPVAHKDLHETKGVRTTYGSPIFADFVPDFDSVAVRRLKAAGAISLGKTNTPEFGLGSQVHVEYDIEQLSAFVDKHLQGKEVYVTFYGGEPTLNKKLMLEVMQRFPRFRFQLQTNATLIDNLPEWALNRLSNVLASIDGGEATTVEVDGAIDPTPEPPVPVSR